MPFQDPSRRRGNPDMPPTLWNLVFTASENRSPDALAALGKLCESYWYPLYSFVRKRGNDHHRAQDLTQGFFERKWARQLVDRATRILEEEYRRCDKELLFASLFPYVTRPVPIGFYAEAAVRLNMSESALKVALHRLIPRFGQVLRGEVALTVSSVEMIDEELREIIKAWANHPTPD